MERALIILFSLKKPPYAKQKVRSGILAYVSLFPLYAGMIVVTMKSPRHPHWISKEFPRQTSFGGLLDK